MNLPKYTPLAFFALLIAISCVCTAEDRYEAWMPKKDDHVLFTKEYGPVGSVTEEKAMFSFWCSQATWDSLQPITDLGQIHEVLGRSSAVALAKAQVEKSTSFELDYEKPKTELIIVESSNGDSTQGEMKFYYYVRFPAKLPNRVSSGVVVLSSGEVRKGMPYLARGSNWKWADQKN